MFALLRAQEDEAAVHDEVRNLQRFFPPFEPSPSPSPSPPQPLSATDPVSYGYFWFLVAWYALFAIGLGYLVHKKRTASRPMTTTAPTAIAEKVVVNPMALAKSEPAAVKPPPSEDSSPVPVTKLLVTAHVEARAYVTLLLLMLLSTILLFAVVGSVRAGGSGSSMEALVGAASGAIASIMLHMTLAPIIILLKLFDVLQPPSDEVIRERARRTESRSTEPWVVSSAAPTLVQRLMLRGLCALNHVVLRILKILASIGLDLGLFYFPEPFVRLSERKMVLDAVRIDGHRIALSANWHDVYLHHVFQSAMDLWTCTCWSRRFALKNFDRWLDSRLRWVDDKLPEGCTADGDFVYFGSTPTFRTRCWVFWCGSCFPPCLGPVYSIYLVENDHVRRMKFGGRRIRFRVKPTFCEWLFEYGIKSACGIGACWRRFLDSRVEWEPIEPKPEGAATA